MLVYLTINGKKIECNDEYDLLKDRNSFFLEENGSRKLYQITNVSIIIRRAGNSCDPPFREIETKPYE